MGEASEGRSRRAMEALSLEIEKHPRPRDLLQRFVSPPEQSGVVVGDDSEEVELNLGLSLGGRFGVDKSSNKLIRSSSIAGSIPPAEDAAAGSAAPAMYPALMRTSSLPVETEEQWRKRKELQSLRRMEAKRRRSEKQRNSTATVGRDCGVDEERHELENPAAFNSREKQHFATSNRFSSTAAPPFGLPSWAAAAVKSISGDFSGRFLPPAPQGSAESQGGSSSGNSDPESKTAQGPMSNGEAGSPGRSNQDSKARAQKPEMENSCKKPEMGVSGMGDMPSVFTKGEGPNGRRVDGILYKYGKGEEVRIMCVCHGSFLSPADFVKHAGGVEVGNPLRHIVINPSASSFLS